MTIEYGLDENSSNRSEKIKINYSNKLSYLYSGGSSLKTRYTDHNSPFDNVLKMDTPLVLKQNKKLVSSAENHPDKSASGTARHHKCTGYCQYQDACVESDSP